MSYIARTNGGRTVLEFRQGTLDLIPLEDRENWRVVTENRPGVDNWTQVITVPQEPVVSEDGSTVSMGWYVAAPPVVWNRMRLKDYADAAATRKINAGMSLPNGDAINTNDHSLLMLVISLLALQGGSITPPLEVPTISGWTQMDLGAIQGVFGFIAYKGRAIYAAWKSVYDQIDAGTITTSTEIDGVFASL
jgi:hypothetical protein